MEINSEIECPRCGNSISVEIENCEEGSQEVECDTCRALLELTYTISVEVDDVNVIEAPPIDFECPDCNCAMTEEIEEESGSIEVECENDKCSALLEVTWSDWGESVDVNVLEKPDEEDDEEDDEEEEEEVKKIGTGLLNKINIARAGQITTGLRKGPSANKNALSSERLTSAFLFRKPTTLNAPTISFKGD